ncbi:MAG: GH25 family lysozyme [Eggerthellales bacterium]|nr:GH25 family lysozyme [Eggerthellales bacterium]
MYLKRTLGVLVALALSVVLAPATALAGEHQPDPLDHAALAAQQAGEDGLAPLAEGAWQRSDSGYLAEDAATIIPGALAKGIDVSSHQGWIDWDAVKADGITFAIIRCGYGGDYSDQDDAFFEYNASECERLGIPYGIYLYSYAYNTDMALSEAEHVLRVIAGYHPTYPVYYDLEYTYDDAPAGNDSGNNVNMSNDELAEVAAVFCQHIAAAGYTPAIYASLNWWNNFLTDSAFDQWERWVAQYPWPGDLCSYQGEYRVWQAASDATVAGVSGNVDIDFEYYPYRGGAGFTRGDLNLNGQVNIVDAQLAWELARNWGGDVWCEVRAQGVAWTDTTVKFLVDVNEDGQLDASDALAIQSAALRGWR